MKPHHDIKSLGRHFYLYGEFREAKPYGTGHINDTYYATYEQGGMPLRYIHQRINHNVFKHPAALMDNVSRVTRHIRLKLDNEYEDLSRRVLTIVPARDGRDFYVDGEGNHWRTYVFIEKAHTYEAVESPTQAFQAAKAFGEFQKQLADLPAPRLHDTIPDFHNTPKRFAALEQAIAADSANRAKLAKKEIEFALRHKPIAGILVQQHKKGAIPERITHNDTKFNNVMLDDTTHKGICVIDLDTVMPGLTLYDFGDMIRTTTSPAQEDERNLSLVEMQFPMFDALVRGYLSTAGEFLNKAEKEYLAFSGKLITFEIGIRFLTDFLAGDVYFKTHRKNHNLDRCRTQFRLVECIEEQEDKMNKLVASV